MSEQALENKPEEAEKKQRKWDLATVLDVASYIAAPVVSWFSFKSHVGEELYKYHDRLGLMDDLLKTEKAEYSAKMKAGPADKVNDKVHKARVWFEGAKNDHYKEQGYKSTWGKFRNISRNGQIKAVVDAVTAGSMTFTASQITANSGDVLKTVVGRSARKNVDGGYVGMVTDANTGDAKQSSKSI